MHTAVKRASRVEDTFVTMFVSTSQDSLDLYRTATILSNGIEVVPMALPSTANAWSGGLDFPSRLFERGGNDYELYEQDDEFVLTVELPGFDPADITVTWDDGVLYVAGEHEDEFSNTRRTYHRRFRFPKTVDDDAIEAEYRNGILTVQLPIAVTDGATGTEIPIES